MLVRRELKEAREQHPPLNSAHEGWAVLHEELHEFWQEVLRKPAHRDKARMLAELVQVGAMAQRVAEDLGFIRRTDDVRCSTGN